MELFSIPIFFIVLRETLEGAIIISVLLGLADQLGRKNDQLSESSSSTGILRDHGERSGSAADAGLTSGDEPRPESEATFSQSPRVGDSAPTKATIRKMKMQIIVGAGLGFGIALVIGGAFIVVWVLRSADLWGQYEDIIEGVFGLIASILIFVMSLGMLRLEHSRAKWRAKLHKAYQSRSSDQLSFWSKNIFFLLPFVTVLREGVEAVVFVGGVSLGQPASSIPIATLAGIVAGIAAGWAIYSFGTRTTLKLFVTIMTNFLLLVGAGLMSRSVGAYERYQFNRLVGGDAAESGDGPGSFDVRGNIWHLNCCNPENKLSGRGWLLMSALLGWSNNGSVGTALSYIAYWMALVAALVAAKFREGRTSLFGYHSTKGIIRRAGITQRHDA